MLCPRRCQDTGSADDELGFDQDFCLVQTLAVDQADQALGGSTAEAEGGKADGSERGVEIFREGDIIEADHGYILGDVQSGVLDGKQGADSHNIACDENRSGDGRAIEQILHGAIAAGRGVSAFLNEVAIRRDSGFFQRSEIAAAALLGRGYR